MSKQILKPLEIISEKGANNKDIPEEAKKLKQAYSNEWYLCATDFWYWLQFAITKDEDNKCERPFPTHYNYLQKANKSIDDNQKTIFLKSRRLLISWLGMLRQLHQAMFASPHVPYGHDVFGGGVGSIGQREAEYLMRRIYFVHQRLPDWQKVRNPLVTDNKMFAEFRNGGTVEAFPCKEEGPQTYGFSEFFFDEMALQLAARTTWTGMLPTLGAAGKLVAVSTPAGKNNFFHKIWTDKDNQYEGINRQTIHWTENPEHDQKWYDQVTAGMDNQMIERMFELSFAVYLGQVVWNEFDRITHVLKERPELIEGRPIFECWDFGFHYPAVSWWQVNTKDQWVGYKELQGYDVSFDTFCKQAFVLGNSFYNRSKFNEIHFCDPAGRQRYHTKGRSGAVNDIGEIRNTYGRNINDTGIQLRFGAVQVGTRNNEGPRMKAVRKLWKLRADGQPGILLSPEMELFIEGCAGGYCYPEKGDSEEPEKNEASHLQDTLQYGVTGYDMMGKSTKREIKQPEYTYSKFRTGM